MRNLDDDKKALIEYVDSYQYYIEINSILQNAEAYILSHLNASNPCVVIDIDQTAIDQYELMLRFDFGWCNEALLASNIGEDFPEFKETLLFYNNVKKYVPVIFLTSRRKKYDEHTINLLNNAGYKDYAKLITRPDNSTGTIQDFKINERIKLTNEGYTIIANIGDQESDLTGSYPDKDACFKLPNPFYLITSEMADKYKCTICGSSYKSVEYAIECEKSCEHAIFCYMSHNKVPYKEAKAQFLMELI